MSDKPNPCLGFEGELLRVLGLDHLAVRRLEIVCELGQLPKVRIDGFVLVGGRLVLENGALRRFSEAYELTPLASFKALVAGEAQSASGTVLVER